MSACRLASSVDGACVPKLNPEKGEAEAEADTEAKQSAICLCHSFGRSLVW